MCCSVLLCGKVGQKIVRWIAECRRMKDYEEARTCQSIIIIPTVELFVTVALKDRGNIINNMLGVFI